MCQTAGCSYQSLSMTEPQADLGGTHSLVLRTHNRLSWFLWAVVLALAATATAHTLHAKRAFANQARGEGKPWHDVVEKGIEPPAYEKTNVGRAMMPATPKKDTKKAAAATPSECSTIVTLDVPDIECPAAATSGAACSSTGRSRAAAAVMHSDI